MRVRCQPSSFKTFQTTHQKQTTKSRSSSSWVCVCSAVAIQRKIHSPMYSLADGPPVCRYFLVSRLDPISVRFFQSVCPGLRFGVPFGYSNPRSRRWQHGMHCDQPPILVAILSLSILRPPVWFTNTLNRLTRGVGDLHARLGNLVYPGAHPTSIGHYWHRRRRPSIQQHLSSPLCLSEQQGTPHVLING
jgi:hypothetical protein